MTEHYVRDLWAALDAGVPAGPLAHTRLPLIRSTTGALVHSAQNHTECGELRLWGGPRGSTVETATIAELLTRTFVNAHPWFSACRSCDGEDLDLVENYLNLVEQVRTQVLGAAATEVAALEDDVRHGRHRGLKGRHWDAATTAWHRLGYVRSRLDPAAAAPGRRPFVDPMADLFTEYDPVAARWFTDLVGDLRDRVRHAGAQMVAETTDPNPAADPLWLLVPDPAAADAHWTRSRLPAARLANGADPVGWLDLDNPTPVVLAPYRAAVEDYVAGYYLGPADDLLGPNLPAQLELTARLLRQQASVRQTRGLPGVFNVALGILDTPVRTAEPAH